MNYDIFISCKSEDYPVARKVYQYLRDQKYSVFWLIQNYVRMVMQNMVKL